MNDKRSKASGFVDEAFGRMKPQEVLDIVLPVAERANYVSENNGTIFGLKEIGYFFILKPIS